jgi:OCT family organic cation transporter-like MFS transporter 4/5
MEEDPEKCVKNNDSTLNFNEILNEIGQFGRWQQRIFMCCCLISLANGLITVAFAFTAYSPKYRCSVPFCEDQSNW